MDNIILTKEEANLLIGEIDTMYLKSRKSAMLYARIKTLSGSKLEGHRTRIQQTDNGYYNLICGCKTGYIPSYVTTFLSDDIKKGDIVKCKDIGERPRGCGQKYIIRSMPGEQFSYGQVEKG